MRNNQLASLMIKLFGVYGKTEHTFFKSLVENNLVELINVHFISRVLLVGLPIREPPSNSFFFRRHLPDQRDNRHRSSSEFPLYAYNCIDESKNCVHKGMKNHALGLEN